MEQTAVAVWDFEAEQADELPLKQGDAVILLAQVNDAWWLGRDVHGRLGIFPAAYVAIHKPSAADPGTAPGTSLGTHAVPLMMAQSPLAAPQSANERTQPIVQFLASIELEDYATAFNDKGYDDLDILEELTEADLDEIGIVPIEHRRRIMNAINTSRSRSNSEHEGWRTRSPDSIMGSPPVAISPISSVSPQTSTPAAGSPLAATQQRLATEARAVPATRLTPSQLPLPPPASDASAQQRRPSLTSPEPGPMAVSPPVLATSKEKHVPTRKSGWLFKQGDRVKAWKRRWIVLEAGELRYYKGQQDKEPAGVLRLMEMLRVGPSPIESRKDPRFPHCFHLATTRDRVFMFCAETDREMTLWMDMIETLISIKEKLAGPLASVGEPLPVLPAKAPLVHSTLSSSTTTPLKSGASDNDDAAGIVPPKDEGWPSRGLSFSSTAALKGSAKEEIASLYASASSVVSSFGRNISNRIPAVPGRGPVKENQTPKKSSEDGLGRPSLSTLGTLDDQTAPDKEGWLKKMGNNVQKDWKRRYVVLKSGKLFYYRSYEDYAAASPINFIELLTTTVKPSLVGNKCRFELVTIQRTYWFQAESTSELNEWATALQGAIAQALTNVPSDRNSVVSALLMSSKKAANAMEVLRDDSSNRYCADCGTADPEWASGNLGILICIECSGVHRSLGVQISKVKSLTLDDWSSSSIKLVKQIGNEIANAEWEAAPGVAVAKPNASAPSDQKRQFIRAKYVDKQYVTKVGGHIDTVDIIQKLTAAVEANDVRVLYHLLVPHWPPATLINTAVECLPDNDTLVMRAAVTGALECCEFLAQNGADVSAKNKNDATAVQLAEQAGHEAIVKCLQQSSSGRVRKETNDDATDADDETHMDYRCGYMFKRGEVNKFWKRRWFVFEDGTMRYYRLKEDREPAGTIIMADMVAVTMKEEPTKPFYFELLTRRGRIYELAADNEPQMCDWMDVLRLAIDRRWASLEFANRTLDLANYVAHGPTVTREEHESRWRKRWSLLKEKTLYHFADENHERLMSSVDLRQMVNVEQDVSYGSHGDKAHNVLNIKTQTRTHYMMMDSLEECTKWIVALKSTQIFGLPLNMAAGRKQGSHDKGVPLILVKCISYLNTYGLEQEGLYRIPGDVEQVQKLRTRFNQEDTAVNLSSGPDPADVHVVATLVKMYLRELPDALVPQSIHQRLLEINKATSLADQIQQCYSVLTELPECNLKTLRKVINHLDRLLELSEINHMTLDPLSAIFAMCIFRGPEHTAQACHSQDNQLISFLISHYTELFEDSAAAAAGSQQVKTVGGGDTVTTTATPRKITSELPTLCAIYMDDGNSSSSTELRSYVTPLISRTTAKEVVHKLCKRVSTENAGLPTYGFSLFEVLPDSERIIDEFEKVLAIVNSWPADMGGRIVFKHNPLRTTKIPLNAIGFPDMRGWLFKAAQNEKNWRRRYCILRPEGIFYFTDEKNLMNPRGVIPIYGLVVSTLRDRKKAPAQFCFSISRRWPKSHQEDFCRVFSTETDEQRLMWMAGIRVAKKPRVMSDATLFAWPPPGFEALFTSTVDVNDIQGAVSEPARAERSSLDKASLTSTDEAVQRSEQTVSNSRHVEIENEDDDDEDDDDEDALERAEEEAEKARALQRQQQVQRISVLRRSRFSGSNTQNSAVSVVLPGGFQVMAHLTVPSPTSSPPPRLRLSGLPPPPPLPAAAPLADPLSEEPITIAVVPPPDVMTDEPASVVDDDVDAVWDELEQAERELYEIEQELDRLAEVGA